MTTPIDETRVGLVMRDMLSAGAAQTPPVDPSELRRRAGRRGLRRLDTKVFFTVVAVAAVIVTLIVVGPLRSDSPPSHPPTATQPTSTTTPPTTTTTTTTTTTVPVAAASQLAAYVAAEQQTDSTAYTANGVSAQHGNSPFLSAYSAPVADDGRTVAVVAFSYDPGGHPVQVLGYRDKTAGRGGTSLSAAPMRPRPPMSSLVDLHSTATLSCPIMTTVFPTAPADRTRPSSGPTIGPPASSTLPIRPATSGERKAWVAVATSETDFEDPFFAVDLDIQHGRLGGGEGRPESVAARIWHRHQGPHVVPCRVAGGISVCRSSEGF